MVSSMKYIGTKTKSARKNDCDIFDRDIRRRPVRARTVGLSKKQYREQYEKALELIQNLEGEVF
jgi:hypothetical protein